MSAVTLGAGVQWHEAYDFAQKNGRFIVGGVDGGGSIGAAGGWLMGGGHGMLSPKYGLGMPPSFAVHSACLNL
jgi:FAD/FMN-containing dehydrogenase